MLRSFQYSEKPYTDYAVQSNLLHMKEIDIARRFVESHPARRSIKKVCPICGKSEGTCFFTKWKVDYLRCEECDTVYAVCEEDVVSEYLIDKDLMEFRLNEEYQNQISENRQDLWDEFLEWVQIRTYRFAKKNKALNVVDIGNRLSGFVKAIRTSMLCGRYRLVDSIYNIRTDSVSDGEADIVFYNDIIKTEICLPERFESIRRILKGNGLLFIGARAGSGFDVITLKESNTSIYPYEHIVLPSVKGIMLFLQNNGFEVLEITSPGVMDVSYVMKDFDKLGNRELFVRYLLKEGSRSDIQDFQRFLQKSCMSSFIRVIARKAE